MADEHSKSVGATNDDHTPNNENEGESTRQASVELEETSLTDSNSLSATEKEPTADPEPVEDAPPQATSTVSPSSTPWQAIFSPQYNAYYFYNTETQQTTWENPLLPSASPQPQPDPSAPESTHDDTNPIAGYTNPAASLQTAALAAGIDPALAHLDPSLLAAVPSGSSSSPAGLPPTFTAKFNARTGQFARPDARDPTHLSEHARAARMSEFYFDVGAWENQLAEQGGSIMGEEGGRKRKRPTKKDLERFKEQKRLKKIAKTAWLRT